MKRLALVALCLLIPATGARSQCLIGLYSDPEGVHVIPNWSLFTPFDFYAILRVDDAVEGVAYQMTYPSSMLVVSAAYSPDGSGFEFLTPNGTIIGFGECAYGFGGTDILVAHFQGYITDPQPVDGEYVRLLPNVDENPDSIIYATCGGLVKPCPSVVNLFLGLGGPVESRSFAAVKSLF